MGSEKRYQMTCESPSECNSWIRLFRAMDTDHDGFIPTTELKRAVRESTFSFGMSPDEVTELIHHVDVNRDHLVDFAEFCTLMSRAKHMRLRHIIFRAAQFVVPRSKRTEPFSYLQQYKCLPPPLLMLLFSIIEICIYGYYVHESGEGIQMNKPVPTQSPLIFNPHLKKEVWRFVTYMFIHIGIFHLIFNVLTQIILGIPLELVHQWRVAIVYLGGVITGSVLVAAVDPHVYLAGASGGVYALLAAHVAELLLNWSEMEFAWVRAAVLAILIGSDVGVAVYQRYYVDVTDRISYVSHIGGFVAGICLGIVVLRNFRKHNWERVVWWMALMTFVLFFVVSVLIIAAPNMF